MNLTQLKSTVSSLESDTVEFKRSTGQRTEAAKTAYAMLNGKGGHIVFGADNDGHLSGQEIGALNIIDWCESNGNAPPSWTQRTGSVIVTFSPIDVKNGEQTKAQLESQLESQSESLMTKVVEILSKGEYSRSMIAKQLGQQKPSGHLHKVLREMFRKGLIDRTIPEKPQSRLQKYRLTVKGKKQVKQAGF